MMELLEAVEFDGVADGGTGAVAFDEVDGLGAPLGLMVSGVHGAELAVGVGLHEVSGDVVGEPDGGDGGVDVVAVAECVVESFECEDTGAFADDEPVGGGVEGCAAAGGREGVELREAHLGVEAVGP